MTVDRFARTALVVVGRQSDYLEIPEFRSTETSVRAAHAVIRWKLELLCPNDGQLAPGGYVSISAARACCLSWGAERRDRFAELGVPQFGVAGGVAEQDNLVDPSHPSIIAGPCKNRV